MLATVGQFHEFVAKLLTKVDYRKIEFLQIQKFIRHPEEAVVLIVNFINLAMRLPIEDLVIGNRYDDTKKIKKTVLQKGDMLIFHYKDGTMAAHRASLKKEGVDLCFNRIGNNLDDKNLTELVKLNDILLVCSLYAALIGCRAEWQYKEHMQNGLIYVKLI